MNYFKINLQLFSEAAGADAPAEAASAQNSDKQTERGASAQRVLYGKQDIAVQKSDNADIETDVQKSVDAGEKPEQSEPTFEELINGKYKSDYEKLLQKRFKKSAEAQKQNEAMRELLSNVARGYGLDPESETLIDDIKKAQDEDEDLFSKEAYERGISIDEYKRQIAKDKEIKALTEKVKANEEKERSIKWISSLKSQADELKKTMPNFDLDAEMKNPAFAYLVRPGSPTSLEDAMYAVHHREILSGAVKTAAQDAAKKTANAVAANAARPKEGGLSSIPPAVIKDDPSKWTKEDRAEIRRRVMRGEKIKL